MTISLFVTADWLADHYNDKDIQCLDARMLPPGQQDVRDITAEYLAGHLPNAPFFNIERLSDTNSPYPHMMPDAQTFTHALRQLGVTQHKHLVIYDEGNLYSAPRGWWMLQSMGVKRVSILAGGLRGWQQAGYSLVSGPVTLPESDFNARYDSGRVKSLADMRLISEQRSAQIIDVRPANRFNGEVDEPRPGLHRGRIPGSINIPWDTLTQNGQLKPLHALTALFSQHGIDLKRPIVATCGSGVTAAVAVLALTSLGVKDVALYDGAWSEWGSRHDVAIEK